MQLHRQFEASNSSMKLTTDCILCLPPIMFLFLRPFYFCTYPSFCFNILVFFFMCAILSLISLRILRVVLDVFFPLLPWSFLKLFVLITTSHDRGFAQMSGILGCLIFKSGALKSWSAFWVHLLGMGWGLFTAHLKVDLQRRLTCLPCLVWGHPDVRVFSPFLIGWSASLKKNLSSNGLAARVLGAEWGKEIREGTSALIPV